MFLKHDQIIAFVSALINGGISYTLFQLWIRCGLPLAQAMLQTKDPANEFSQEEKDGR